MLILVLGLAAVGAVFRAWNAAGDGGGQQPAEPFRIAGNFYYVGATDVTSFLITGPAGHVLIDGGYTATPPLILASIAKLGFDIRDVKVILNSEPHMDHAGGLLALQQASGAELWASEASANAIASGGDDPNMAVLPWRVLFWIGIGSYPAARASTTGSRTATRSVSGRSRSPRTSPAATLAAARRGRSRFAMVTATWTS